MSAAKEGGPPPADGEDERVLALLQGLSDKLGAVEQEILTDASGRTTRRVKDKVVVSVSTSSAQAVSLFFENLKAIVFFGGTIPMLHLLASGGFVERISAC